MLRRFRKRRGREPHDNADDDQGGGHHHDHADDDQGCARSKPLALSLDENGQQIFSHMYDTECGRKKRGVADVDPGGEGRAQQQRYPHTISNSSDDANENDPAKFGSNDEAIINSISVMVNPKEEPSPSSSKTGGGGASMMLAQQRQEWAQQKMDYLSRRHQLRRKQQQQKQQPSSQWHAKYTSTSITVDTPNTLRTTGSHAAGADTGDTSLPRKVHQQRRHSQQQQIFLPIVPPSSMTRHLASATCGVVDDTVNACNTPPGLLETASSFESSVYRKYDFHSRAPSASLRSRSDGGKMLHHENDYQPTPPSMRRERNISGWIGEKTRSGGQAGERRRVSEELKQHQEQEKQIQIPKQQQEHLHYQKLQQQNKEQKKKGQPQKEQQRHQPRIPSPIPTFKIVNDDMVTWVTPKELMLDFPEGKAATLIDKDPHRDSKNGEVSTKTISSSGDGSNTSSTMPKDKSRSPPPAETSLVTPSPPPSKNRFEPEPDTSEKHQQSQQRSKQNEQQQSLSPKSAPPLSTVDVVNSTPPQMSTSTSPTARLVNSSKLINRLLKRHQIRKIELMEEKQLEQQQQQQNQRNSVQPQSQPWSQPQSPQEKDNEKDPKKGIQWRGEEEVKRRQSINLFDESSSSSSPQPRPPATVPPLMVKVKEVKREEPPEESPQQHQQARQPPPDPPGKCHHMPSKALASLKQQQPSAKYQLVPSYNFTGFTPQPSSKFLNQLGQQQSKLLRMSESPPQQAKLERKFNPPQLQLNSQKKMQSELLSKSQSKSLQKKSMKDLPDPSKIKGRSKSKQEQGCAEWTVPIPLKKVNSTPSNFSSLFTFQTSNTTSTSKFWDEVEDFSGTNHPHSKNNRGAGGDGYDNVQIVLGKHDGKNGEKEHDNYVERYLVEVKKDKIKQRRQWQNEITPDHAPKNSDSPKNSAPQIPHRSPSGSSHRPRSQQKQPHHFGHYSLESINEDVISNSFSLTLSLNQYGYFDVTDISALQMNDSATIYFQRQLQNAANAADGNNAAAAAEVAAIDYWKKKYDKLMEETNKVKGMVSQEEEEEGEKVARPGKKREGDTLTKKEKQVISNRKGRFEIKQVELKEMMDHHDKRNVGAAKAADQGGQDMSLEETNTTNNIINNTTQKMEQMEQAESITNDGKRQHQCSSPLDAITQLLETSLDSCDIDQNNNQQQEHGVADYHGNKKWQDLPQKEAEDGKNVNANCSLGSGLSGEELDWIMSRAQRAREVGVNIMKKTAVEMNFISKLEQEDNDDNKKEQRSSSQKLGDRSSCQGRNGDVASKDIKDQVLQCNSMCSVRNVTKDMMTRSLLQTSKNVSPQLEQEGHKGAMGIQELFFETIHTEDTDGYDLQPKGYIPREATPTFTPTSLTKEMLQPKLSSKYVMDEEGGRGNDLALLQRWNKNCNMRSPKALADDLTAGASRVSCGTVNKLSSTFSEDQSELSDNAQMIFDGVLRYDRKILHSQSSTLRLQQRSMATKNPGGNGTGKLSVVSSMEGLKLWAAGPKIDFLSNITGDFATWFELPSPGGVCTPLLPLSDITLLNPVSSYRVDDVVNMVFSDFACAFEGSADSGSYMGKIDDLKSILFNGEKGPILFTNALLHLPEISMAAVSAISRRQFQDAMEIYTTLLHMCETCTGCKLGIVGQLIASTLHNLSVLHLWNCEYDQALPYCRESLRMKVELLGDDTGSVNLWSNLGLIYYTKGSLPSALAAFREAVQLSSKYFPQNGQLTGRLVNNMACVNFEIGKLPLVQRQFKLSLQMQKGGPDSHSLDSSESGEDLFSLSITVFNIGVVCARQDQTSAAISHVNACLAIQQALLGNENKIVLSTAQYLESLLRKRGVSFGTLRTNLGGAKQTAAQQNHVQPRIRAFESAPISVPETSISPETNNEPLPQPHLNKKLIPQQWLICRDAPPPSSATIPTGVVAGMSKSKGGQNAPQGREQVSHSPRVDQIAFSAQDGEQISNHTLVGRNAPLAQGREQIARPVIRLGSLRAEATIAERVRHSLEGIGCLLVQQGGRRGHNLSALLCKRPPTPITPPSNSNCSRTISRNIISYGLQMMKKREAQLDLQRNLQWYGPKHPLVGESHCHLGLFYLCTENYKDAITHLSNSVRIYSNTLGMKHPDVAFTLMFKGLAQLAHERPDDAMTSMVKVHHMQEEALGPKHPELGRILNNMACIQYELGDYKRAESLFQEALDLQRETFTTEPSFLMDVSVVLCNIAFLHAKSGSFPKALIEFEGALQIRHDILHAKDDSLVDITENMAHILAIYQLQHGAMNLDEITEEYIAMFRKSET